MLTRVRLIEFVRPLTTGRTRPFLVVGQTPDGEAVGLVAKFSAGCDEQVTSLAREVITACLAADLGLPVPGPFLIEIAPGWADLVPDQEQRTLIRSSSPIAFGSRLITGQYAAWNYGNRISEEMLPTAAAVFVFDAITQNADRRAGNPNCLTKADEIVIFDHEMTFMHDLVIGWRPPWLPGGLKNLEKPGSHIFREQLGGRVIDFQPIRAAWSSLRDRRIAAYGRALPAEWAAATGVAQEALALIREARNNIDGCLAEVERVLGCRTPGPTATRF